MQCFVCLNENSKILYKSKRKPAKNVKTDVVFAAGSIS